MQRYLDDQPILARRASLLERYARWARRHPDIAVLGGVLTAVLVLTLAGSIIAASRFREQARRQSIIARESDLARGHAEMARRLAETVVVDMHAANGLVAAERNDPARAMLWFAQAAELAQHDRDRERVNRIRACAGSARRSCLCVLSGIAARRSRAWRSSLAAVCC